ncbi:uncharacterized protein ARMOST_20060 [Armillaria ostoyae]|uniref:GED domain-containing protein n=1 Tax=Armillaria ostoyae TaxID=47428 RepID=A0A284S697_ARMOS|nr:uncharacterized protein ARMOST_20060 [Armillaria ostoyae]
MSTFFGRRPARRGTTNGDRSANTIPNGTHTPPAGDSSPHESDSEQDSTAVPINQTEYAQRCREVMELYRALQGLGADSLLTMLPKIIVIGGQSTGKSSLVEAVSGINVPRDSGTCTRCPMECTMLSSSSTWSCTIYLNIKYAPGGGKLAIPDKAQFGPVITNKDTVEVWIRRAQAAILCRHRPKEDFTSMTTEELRNLATTDSQMLPFSKNIVQVELRDPDLTDLSFIDLPGKTLLSLSSYTDRYFGRDYPQCGRRDYHTCSRLGGFLYRRIGEYDCPDYNSDEWYDIEMQAAVKLAKSKDPNGDRTIGVLTKPDMLTTGASGARDKWREIILGQDQRHKLQHGYYCVRLPDDDERRRNISRDESQTAAQQFFDRTSPWRDFPDRSRFGIPALVRDISRLLVGLIENYIPTLKESVDNLLTSDRAEFNALPPPPPTDEAWSQIIILIHHFCSDVKATVEGKEEHKKLVQRNRARYERLKHDILSTCPNFRPFEDKTRYRDPHIQDEEFEGKSNPYVHMATSNYIMDIKDVRREIENCTSWELPGEVPLETTPNLINRFTKEWSNPSVECFNDVYRASSVYIQKLVTQHFGQFKLLETHIGALVRSQMEIYKSETLVTLEKAVKLETSPVFTQVPHYLMERSKWLERFRKVYKTSSTYAIHRPGPSDSALRPFIVGAEYHTVRETTEDEEALLVMAKVRAYFEMAYKRFIDNVPLTIEHELHQTLPHRLSESLIKDMGGPDARERARELFREDPVIASRREILKDRIARLEEIRRRLYSFR